MRQSERFAAVGLEALEQLHRQRDVPGEAAATAPVARRLDRQTVEQAALALPTTDVIGAGSAGDRQQPQAHGSIAAEAGQRTQGTEVGLLYEVLDLAIGSEGRAHLPHRVLGAANELGHGDVVTFGGRRGVRPQRVVGEHGPQDAGNCGRSASDFAAMTCARWRDAMSARADGEQLGIDERLLDAHLARCRECRQFATTATRPVAPRLASSPPADLPRRVARTVAAADRASAWTIGRALLAVVAIEIIVVSIPALLGDKQASSTHSARHFGAFAVAYGVGLLVVVARPARARTMLPVAAVLAGALVITSIIDLVEGRIPLVDEAAHLPELVSVGLLWLMAVPSRRSVDGDGGDTGHRLELVETDTDRQVPRSGETEVGRRLIAADPEREHFGL